MAKIKATKKAGSKTAKKSAKVAPTKKVAAKKEAKKVPVIKKKPVTVAAANAKAPITSTTKKPVDAKPAKKVIKAATVPAKKEPAAKAGEAKPRTRIIETLTSEQLKIIEKLDKNFASMKEMEDQNQGLFLDLLETFDGSTTFTHPKHGPMTVMTRVTDKNGEHVYWRGKPVGRAGNGKKAAKKAT